MSKATDALRALIAEVEIEGVRLVEATAETKARSPSDTGAVKLLTDQKAEISEQRDDGTFFVAVTMRATLAPGETEAEKKPLVSITTSFELQYRVSKDFPVNAETLATFAETNGIYNAWPYWREFVQSMVARMGLPPVMLPVLRGRDVMKKVRKSRKKGDS